MTIPVIIGVVILFVILISPSGETNPIVEQSEGLNGLAVLQPGEKGRTSSHRNRRLQQALARREKALDLREENILHKERKLELSFRELSLERKSVATAMEKLSLEEQKSIFKIRGAMQILQDKIQAFDFSKREFNLLVTGKELQDYNRSLKFLENTINEKHRQQMKDLALEEKESKQNFKERRLQLDTHVNAEIEKLRSLKFQTNIKELEQMRRDISQDNRQLSQNEKEMFLKFLEKEFSYKARIIEAHEAEYYMNGKEEFRKAYNSFGFELRNPAIDENRKLRQELRRLKSPNN